MPCESFASIIALVVFQVASPGLLALALLLAIISTGQPVDHRQINLARQDKSSVMFKITASQRLE